MGRIKSGHRLYVSGNAATPFVLLEALALRRDDLFDVEIVHVLLLEDSGRDPLTTPEMNGHFRHNSLFVGPADRDAVNSGQADYIPIFLSDIPGLLKHQLKPDGALIQTSPPDEHGYMSLGVECISTKAAVEAARFVIAQVNIQMPRTLGDAFIHISDVQAIVEVDEDLPILHNKEPDEISNAIAMNIATLIDDGATLQMGIGSIPNAVLRLLKNHKDLGIHSEMVSDGVMDLIESGVITGRKKTLHRKKVITTFYLGSKELYDYIGDNPEFEIHPAEHTNDPFVIAQNDKMVAMNSAIEVDLSGQVCADSIGYEIYSGIGGQVDFIRGASRSKGGMPIIALPSTARGGQISRIVAHLKEGAGVVTARGDVHYVITEHGIANLHGKNLRERAEALIKIADPRFHEELERSQYMKPFRHPND
jgi:acyl-CoA hydrolase